MFCQLKTRTKAQRQRLCLWIKYDKIRMEFAGTFAFQKRYKSTKILQIECVISTGCVIAVPYDGAV